MQQNLIGGWHAVAAVLATDAGRVQRLLLASNRQDQRAEALTQQAGAAGVRIDRVAAAELDKLAPQLRHQGVLAEVAPQDARGEGFLDELLAAVEVPLLLVLDGVTDPHNLGACLRSADAAGVHAVIVPRDKACGLNATVRKVACGAAETIPLVQVTNLARCLRQLRDQGIWLVGTSDQAKQSLYQQDLTGPRALVMGAEGRGLRRLTAEQCDWLVALPMAGSVSSLNVSVAVGVCLFEAVRQRNPA